MDKKLTCSKSRPGHFKRMNPLWANLLQIHLMSYSLCFLDFPDLIPPPAIWFFPVSLFQLYLVATELSPQKEFLTLVPSRERIHIHTYPTWEKGNASDSDSDYMLQTQGNGYVHSQQGDPTTELPPSEAILNVSRVVNQCR